MHKKKGDYIQRLMRCVVIPFNQVTPEGLEPSTR